MWTLLAAALFGLSAPLAKKLLDRFEPVLLAGLLYLGCGLGAGLLLAARRGFAPAAASPRGEAGLRRTDLLWILGASACGGVGGPIVLFLGLRTAPASVGSLLLNFEAVATALIAAVVFREAVGARPWMAAALVTAAGGLLSWDPAAPFGGFASGAVLIALACLLWGIDNNLTRIVSGRDPLGLVAVKGTIAGLASLVLAVVARAPWPPLGWIATALLLGFICYGLSIALFVLGLRSLGTTRTAVHFGTAPFLGAVASILILGERVQPRFAGAFLLMGSGAWLLLGERHEHPHSHAAMAHDHRHRHDDGHHDHDHEPDQIPRACEHAHPHRHAARTHSHPHVPDLHHRHRHPRVARRRSSSSHEAGPAIGVRFPG